TFYFFFIPILRGVRNVRAILFSARQITSYDVWLPFRATLFPLSLTALLTGFVLFWSPDSRDSFSDYLSALASATEWFFATYLALGLGLSVSGTRTDQGISQSTAPNVSRLADFVSARTGLILIFASFGLWAMTLQRLNTLPPSAHVSIDRIAIEDQSVVL